MKTVLTKIGQKYCFSDESKFNLFRSDRRQYVRCPEGKRSDCKYQISTLKYGDGHIEAWGAFSVKSASHLAQIHYKMNGATYMDIL